MVTGLYDISRDVTSATLGSFLNAYTGQPFDTVKVRLQSEQLSLKRSQQATGPLRMTANLLKTEGVLALWKGVIPTGMGMVAENATAFTVNEALKRFFDDNDNGNNGKSTSNGPDGVGSSGGSSNPLVNFLKHDYVKPFAIGCASGLASALVLIPSEIVKSRTQIETDKRVGSFDVFKKCIKRGGLRSMFCGLDAQVSSPSRCTIFFIHSFTHSFTHSLIHSFTHSLIHSFTHSLIHSFTLLLCCPLLLVLYPPSITKRSSPATFHFTCSFLAPTTS